MVAGVKPRAARVEWSVILSRGDRPNGAPRLAERPGR
ncbi:hypothetical protein BURMUCF1_2284, partial [Burkholderia multivorans ATCC BAA-247]